MKRIIFLNRFFFPDHSATSQILTDLRLHFTAQAWTCMSFLASSFMTIPLRTFRAAERDPPPPTEQLR